MNTALPQVPRDGWLSYDNKQYRGTGRTHKLVDGPGNEQRSEREGQPLGPPEIKAPLTQVGVSTEINNRSSSGIYRGEIVSEATGRPIIRNVRPWRRRGRPETLRDPPVPVPPNWTGDRWAIRRRSSGIWTGGCGRLNNSVQKTIATPLSALAEKFTPRKISGKQSTPHVPTDNELDRSLARTGSIKVETPQDVIKSEIATIGMADPTETDKPVAMTDVAEPSGPAVTGAGGPVVVGTRFVAVAEITGASGPKIKTEADGPVVTGNRFRAVPDVAGASGPAVTGASGSVVTRSRTVTKVAGASSPAGTGAGGPVVAGTQMRKPVPTR